MVQPQNIKKTNFLVVSLLIVFLGLGLTSTVLADPAHPALSTPPNTYLYMKCSWISEPTYYDIGVHATGSTYSGGILAAFNYIPNPESGPPCSSPGAGTQTVPVPNCPDATYTDLGVACLATDIADVYFTAPEYPNVGQPWPPGWGPIPNSGNGYAVPTTVTVTPTPSTTGGGSNGQTCGTTPAQHVSSGACASVMQVSCHSPGATHITTGTCATLYNPPPGVTHQSSGSDPTKFQGPVVPSGPNHNPIEGIDPNSTVNFQSGTPEPIYHFISAVGICTRTCKKN